MIKRKLEFLVLGCCAVMGLIWALRPQYLPHIELEQNWLINIPAC